MPLPVEGECYAFNDCDSSLGWASAAVMNTSNAGYQADYKRGTHWQQFEGLVEGETQQTQQRQQQRRRPEPLSQGLWEEFQRRLPQCHDTCLHNERGAAGSEWRLCGEARKPWDGTWPGRVAAAHQWYPLKPKLVPLLDDWGDEPPQEHLLKPIFLPGHWTKKVVSSPLLSVLWRSAEVPLG